MNYATIKKNDIANGEGVCVSLFVSGCPHRCKGCFNQEAWDFNYGQPFTQDTLDEIIKAISANGIIRGFSLLGGEPLCPENAEYCKIILECIRVRYPDIKIYIWTGYTIENLCPEAKECLKYADVLIDGPYIEEQRDITLPLRGSRNQRVIDLRKKL